MKKQDIRNAYTQKVTELLNQGYTIFPDTMNGSQGEIAHIDLTNGSEIIRVLLERGLCWSHISDGFHGDVITLTFSPCRLGVLFNDDAFDHMTVEQKADRTVYRLVFPDDRQTRQLALLWEPDKITLTVKKSQPEPAVAAP